jgi:molecular chaperone GrpE
MSQENENLENEKPESSADENHSEQDHGLDTEMSEDQLRQACHEQICPQCELLSKEKEKTLRAIADADNFKKRLTREKEEFCRYAVTSFVEEIIPILDNLELAIEHGRKNKACKELVQGVEMTMSLFRQALENNNLVQVGRVGEEFDPGVHEALGQEEREDMGHGTVCQVLQKGYLLNDRLVRPAKVMVSKKCGS